MNRRIFLKAIGAAGYSVFAPSSLSLMSLYKSANATVDYAGVNVLAPTVMPQVINIFLYGGPSELAGNLTNIADIENNSQSSYADAFGSGILQTTASDPINGQITPSGFWRDAGGKDMQFMLDQKHMSVYRTLMKRKDPTRSHRESILMSLKGSLDVNVSAGVGTRIAAMLVEHRSKFESYTRLANNKLITNIENDLQLPFVSFEGETRLFSVDPDYKLPLFIKGITLDSEFNDPFSRNNNDNDIPLSGLVKNVVTAADEVRYSGVVDAFVLRKKIASQLSDLGPKVTQALPMIPATASADIAANDGATQVVYPAYPRSQSFLMHMAENIRAATTLAIENPSSLYITVGGGLGGWDDHNDVPARYPQRMAALMATLRSAMLHIKYSGTQTAGVTQTPGGVVRRTDNIVINVFGEFGRLVNLNASRGWDHGNNQNLYTFGGSALRPNNALGKVVGKTERVGESGTNAQVTRPLDGTYTFEPMSVASTIYSYFGASNPEILTADPVFSPNGDPAIDEQQPADPKLF